MLSAQELIAKIRTYHPSPDESLILKAYIFSKNSHGNQKRHSGDPYFSHPVAVAEILSDLKLDQASIITALLHDVVEDTDVTLSEIEDEFGSEIARLVDGVTKLGKIESVPANERVAENFRKLTLAMSGDIRVLLIKLADRLHNMRTLQYVPSREKRVKKARESMDIYASLAGRIGLSKIKDEMQDLAFAIIDADARSQIVQRLDEVRERNKNLIDKIIEDLNQLFDAEKVQCEVSGREKKPYSIWTKMKNFNVSFHDINDIMAFRVVTTSLADCYRVLGVINSNYSMIPGSFKDYISTPKENGYQSLHLTILGPLNKKIEVQIRDQKMHELSDLGVAAHWRYKEKFSGKPREQMLQSSAKAMQEQSQYRWIRELISLFETSESAGEVLNEYKTALRQDEVFCFTPNGDIFNLPLGASVVDFAYAVHSEVGNSCVAARVNGSIVPLRQKIENGDQIEIVTAKTAKPSMNWLQFVITSKAKSAIKNFIRNEKFEEYSKLGKAILQKFFAARSLEINEKILLKFLTKFHVKTVEDLYVRVAEGAIQRYDVLKLIYPDFEEENIKRGRAAKVLSASEKKKQGAHFLPIEGLISGMAMHYAGCCNPIPGDSIVGVINTGSGVTIHTQTCRTFKNLALIPQRIIDVCWKDGDEQQSSYSSRISVIVKNEAGAFANITSVIAKKLVNISDFKTINRSIDYLEAIITLDVKSVDHLEAIISALRISKKVSEVKRV